MNQETPSSIAEAEKPSPMLKPAYINIHATANTDMEPMAQLISVLFDTLNNEAFDLIPHEAKRRALLFVAGANND